MFFSWGIHCVCIYSCAWLNHVVCTVQTGEEKCEVCVCVCLHLPVFFRASKSERQADHWHGICGNWINRSGHLKSRVTRLISPFTRTRSLIHTRTLTCTHTPAFSTGLNIFYLVHHLATSNWFSFNFFLFCSSCTTFIQPLEQYNTGGRICLSSNQSIGHLGKNVLCKTLAECTEVVHITNLCYACM